jgi:diacylglycerol kinase family enzyme
MIEILDMAPGQPVYTRSQLTSVLNATAGGVGKEDIGDRLVDLFRAQGMEVGISFAHSGPERVALARRSAQHTGETVVAGGGDATSNAVASALLGTDKVLGVLPRGSLNDVAKDLLIPIDLESLVQTYA